MAVHTKNALAKLRRKEEILLGKLAELSPDLVAELRGVRHSIEHLGKPGNERYSSIRSVKEAIRACLEHEKRWMLREEIVESLFVGGFHMDPLKGRYLTGDSIRLNTSRGHFVKREDGKIGLPEWANT